MIKMKPKYCLLTCWLLLIHFAIKGKLSNVIGL